MPKIRTNMRFSDEARRLLLILSQKFGISQTDVMELAVREFAEKKGVKSEPSKQAVVADSLSKSK